jgi:hypothetical protein
MSIRTHTVDYSKDRGAGGWINRGFWVHGLPRLMPMCRLFGHRPVIDGYDSKYSDERARWVACDRCGLRTSDRRSDGAPALDSSYSGPTTWDEAVGVFGGQLVLIGAHTGVSVEVKLGNMGSEHTLAGHVHLGKLGALYLHTEKFGTGLIRRFNRRSYESRVIGFNLSDGRFSGKVWAKRDSWSKTDPRWQQWSFQIDPRTILFGPKRYGYTDHGAPVEAVVRMPHGDDYPVKLQLQRQTFGRQKLKRKRLSWCVDWNTVGGGIPTKNTGRGRVSGSGVNVSDAAATDGGWEAEACVAIAAQMTKDRNRYGFELTPRTEAAS